MRFLKKLEISDYTDYRTITQVIDPLKIGKICLINI